jgi:ribonuclease D
MPNLSDPSGQESVDLYADNAELIIVDNLSTMARSGKENEGESWLPLQEWALRHRAQGRAVLFIHHAGKGGQQRGASRREDVLDTVISLRRPAEYDPVDGAKFELHFKKSRNLTGNEAQPLEVQLHGDGKKITWESKPAEAGIIDRLDALVKDGASRAEIQGELSLSRFALNRLAEKANESGITITLPDSRKRGKA